jgi:hypothetical protein
MFVVDNIIKSKDYTLMQYTGLRDKNGTEIYEGDIIRDDRGNMYPIRSVPGGFAMSCFKQSLSKGLNDIEVGFYQSIADPQNASWLKHQEVIGNVYENSELLEQQ